MRVAFVCVLVCAVTAGPAWGRAGDLDPTFSLDGIFATDVGGGEQFNPSGVVLQPDGKIVVAGSLQTDKFALVRLLPDGRIDTSFGFGGLAQIPTPTNGSLTTVARQPDGKIVVGGQGNTPSKIDPDLVFARFLESGMPDGTFGTGGVAVRGAGGEDSVRKLTVQPDGKIVAVGDRLTSESDIIAVRLTSKGDFDGSFDGDGLAIVNASAGSNSEGARGLAVLPDGRVLIGGQTSGSLVAIRLTAGGLPDSGFAGGGGIAYLNAPPISVVTSLVVNAAGQIVLGGRSPGNVLVGRLGPSGTADQTFGAGGTRTLEFGASEGPSEMILLRSGKLAFGGGASTSGPQEWFAARALPDGTADPSFGKAGAFIMDLPEIPRRADQAQGIVEQPDGKLVLAGVGGGGDLAVTRLLADPVAGGPGGALGLTARCGGRRATIVGTNKANRLRGTKRADVIAGLGGNDKISGLGAGDRICGGSGKDRISGGAGKDRVYGDGGNDSLAGGSGNDSLSGGSGNDKLSGNSGKDRLNGGRGRDRLAGGAGRDKLIGGPGKDFARQ